MKTILISSVLLLLSLCVNAQNEKSVTIGKKEIIYSKVLNENRTIWVYTPNITSQNTSPDKRYPVLYLLDGGAHFYSTVGIIQQLSQANGNGVLPEMIVVAIENTNRLRDLVPSADFSKTNPFASFLSSELIPHIDKNYNTAPYKMLVGHSLGGLTAIDILADFPQLFNACIAIDPSMWYDQEKYLHHTISQFAKLNMNGKRLFVGIANTMPGGMAISQLKNDKTDETQHIRSIFKLDEFLKHNNYGLLYAQNFYQAERHNTVPLLSTYDGLRFIFDYYFFDANEKDFTDPTAQIASKLKTHYAKVSKEMGYKNAAPEAFINYLAYDAMDKKLYNKAKALFELNIEWYPQSSKGYDAYADYFLTQKDTINSIANYQKALQIKSDSTIINKLNAVTAKKVPKVSTDYLQKYDGIYTLVDFQLDMALELRNGSLWAKVPGQADEEFQPISENVFTVKGKQGYTITFEMHGGKPKGFTSVQPNGTFKGVFKNK